MARVNYQYETSPRKTETEYVTKKTKKNKKPKIMKEQIEEHKKAIKLERKKNYKNIALIMSMFFLLLAVSYRNSLITEKFNEIQSKKQMLAAVEKTNCQLEVNIEKKMNLNKVEEEAQKKLKMKKLTSDQKVYVNLPTKDYTETNAQNILENEETNWFMKIINKLFN